MSFDNDTYIINNNYNRKKNGFESLQNTFSERFSAAI